MCCCGCRPGVYEMTVEASGFRRMVAGRWTLQVGGVAEVEVRLKGPGATTVVTVNGEAGECVGGADEQCDSARRSTGCR